MSNAARFESNSRSRALHRRIFKANDDVQQTSCHCGSCAYVRLGLSGLAVSNNRATHGHQRIERVAPLTSFGGRDFALPVLAELANTSQKFMWLAEARAMLGQPIEGLNYLAEAVQIIETTGERHN